MRLCLSCCRARLASSCSGNARPWRVCARLSKPNSMGTCEAERPNKWQNLKGLKTKWQNSDCPKPALAPSESRFVYVPPEDTTESSESVSNKQHTIESALTMKVTYPHNFILQTPEEETHTSAVQYNTLTPQRLAIRVLATALMQLYLCYFNLLQLLFDH